MGNCCRIRIHGSLSISIHQEESRTRRFGAEHIEIRKTDWLLKTIIAHQDPGLLNWLDTAGHIEGVIGFRWMQCDESPEVQCQVVKLSDL